MINNLLQTSPYIRSQRQFPEDDLKACANQMDHAYIDIAGKINVRIIGLFATKYQIVTGEKWYFKGGNASQQSLRQVYTFTAAGNIAHGIDWNSVSMISPHSYGSYTDGTNWYGVIYATSGVKAGLVTFFVTPTDIVVLSGAGSPAITSGFIVLEFISNF